MLYRCNNPKSKSFHRYGERGIKVCKEWTKSFEKFYIWAISNGYHNRLTIDRIDNNKGYCLNNCRWATLAQQARNKENSISLDQVKLIKRLLKQKDLTHKEIAAVANTTHHRVSCISKRHTWVNT